ncbi:hypothetical protein AVEN_189355-1 [Araneus ventricosus]|uniref:Uncharacterized protein n=1 Tax=Araneus ventricosus TaxID=182803 RepID=A0A4Y2EFK4_ARAVE|nr:hypothetical protein AVEN_189355-1 [Araneus ventricosus]
MKKREKVLPVNNRTFLIRHGIGMRKFPQRPLASWKSEKRKTIPDREEKLHKRAIITRTISNEPRSQLNDISLRLRIVAVFHLLCQHKDRKECTRISV